MGIATLNVLHRIQSLYHGLSEKEKLVADYILSRPDEIVYQTINQIADELDVADATVFRFSKRLGYRGFQQLKIALASEQASPTKDILETIKEEDNELEITKKVFQSNMNAIEFTRDIQTGESIKVAVQYLVEADSIHFYGNGGSGIVGLDAQHKFMRTGLFCQAHTDSHLQLMSASQLNEKSCAIFISHSGTNKDLLEVVDVAQETHARTIGITNFSDSLLSKHVDVCLYTSAQETEYRPEALASRIAELSIIDALFVNYCMQCGERTTEALSKIRDAVSRKK